MGILRRDILRLSAGLPALSVASRLAFADTYPSRPVRVLVATSAGGSGCVVTSGREEAARACCERVATTANAVAP